VLLLREVEQMSYAQIAAVVNVPIGTVMLRLARSREMLRGSFPDDGEESSRAMR
jgi:RNA polymerase sigma-70 factor (ECF subfamily)